MTAVYYVPVDLLDRALEVLRGELEAMVECICEIDPADDELGPLPGTATTQQAAECLPLLALVQQLEGIVGRFEIHENPQWLDDLLDGKWGLTTDENCPGHVASAADPKVCAHCAVHIDELRPPDDDPINLQGSGPGAIEERNS